MFINPRNITIQDIYIKVTSFNIYPNFWDYIYRVGFPCNPKSLNFHLLLDKNTTYWEKKVPLIAFRQVSTKILPPACIQLLWYIWKSSIKTKSLNTKQSPAGLSPRIIRQVSPFLTKNVKKLVHPPGVDCPSFPWTFMGNPGDGEKS